MRVWHLRIAHYALRKLTDVGKLPVSGRWHTAGQAVLYTSATASLAALEFSSHVDPSLAPSDLMLTELEIPGTIRTETWSPAPLTRSATSLLVQQEFGAEWLNSRRSAVLCVPSAVIPVENNYLINPAHPAASKISIVQRLPFSF